MPSLFKRISDVITANLNDLVDRVEDPERMIKQLIREMEENISSAKESVIDALASEKQLGKELDSQRRQAEDCSTNVPDKPWKPATKPWREKR
ncbi:MAG: PspA/IM30 family protein [Candidatus Competibacteraceae bacterium]